MAEIISRSPLQAYIEGGEARERQQSTDINQRAAEQRIDIVGQNQGNAEQDREMRIALDRTKLLNNTGKALLSIDETQWPQALERIKPMADTLGLDLNQVVQGGLNRESLQSMVSETGAFLQNPDSLMKPQFGSQSTFKDSEGNLYFGTQRRQGANVDSVLSPVGNAPAQPVGDVQLVGSFGLTADESTTKKGADVAVGEAAKFNAEERQQYIKGAVAARSMIPKTEKLIELNEAIQSGKLSVAQKFFTDLFGTTGDLGEFNARAGALVLENIRALGANPTEGERAFLEQITPSLRQGKEVNRKLLEDMLSIQKRQLKRGKWFAENPGKTIEEYLLETDEEDFTPTSDSGVNTPEGTFKSSAGITFKVR